MVFKRSLVASGAIAMLALGAWGVQQGVQGAGGAPHDGVSAAGAHYGKGYGQDGREMACHRPPNTPWT